MAATHELEVLATFNRHFVDGGSGLARRDAVPPHRLRELDPFAELLSPEEPDPGAEGGVGVRLVRDGDAVIIAGVIPGYPAAGAGLVAGDQIVAVDAEAVPPGAIEQVLRQLRGAVGTRVHVRVRTPPGTRTVELVREAIVEPPLGLEVTSDGLGYLAIPVFHRGTGDEFVQLAQAWAQTRRLSGLVLDLRDNPGGELHSAVTVADEFLTRGLIVSLHGREGTEPIEHYAHPGAHLASLPLLVLVNARTGSAAEVLAAALQDHGRARIAGQRTWGKGSVQTVLPLATGGALKLTTHRYRTPAGRSLDGVGVVPDYPLESHSGAGVADANTAREWRDSAGRILRREKREVEWR